MSHRDRGRDHTMGEAVGGLGDFLRSLLSGIPWSERAEAAETFTVQAPRSGTLRIDNSRGRTRVIGEDRTDLEIQVARTARAETQEAAERLARTRVLGVNETDTSLDLEIDMPRRWNRRGCVNLELRVPRQLRVEVAASNGKVELEGLRGSVRVRSSNGHVRVDSVTGDVEIHASNAKVRGANLHGKVTVRTSNGKIELSGCRGSLDASTSNGLIQAQLEELGEGGVSLATSNGRIVLELPEAVDADVDLRVDNGVIRNQRPLCRCTRSTSGRLTGLLGRGGRPIRVRTSNGSISLR
jgi:DUF4097 and DUF4098 domain-containing protein YvlB